MTRAATSPPASSTACPLCGAASSSITEFAWRCGGCGVAFSNLEPSIGVGEPLQIDEDQRSEGLRPIRDRGYGVVLDRLAAQRPLAGLRVLDIGCGHGWFLEAAGDRGMTPLGLEPDPDVAARVRAAGLPVREGFFPDDVAAEEQFDVIVFNDVLEHLPEPGAVLDAVRERLAPGGLLAISIPTTEGAGYRASATLRRLGVAAPSDRLWQRDLPSPHLWYFDTPSLKRLVGERGFDVREVGRLPSIERRGLRQRVAAAPGSKALALASVAAVWIAAPLLNGPRRSDALYLVATRTS